MAEINWDIPLEDRDIIADIVERAVNYAEELGFSLDVIDLSMDLTAAHLNGCPLNLRKLYDADDSNLAHDVFGIRRYLNRETGELENHFLPRCHA